MPVVPLLSFVLSEGPCAGLWTLRPMAQHALEVQVFEQVVGLLVQGVVRALARLEVAPLHTAVALELVQQIYCHHNPPQVASLVQMQPDKKGLCVHAGSVQKMMSKDGMMRINDLLPSCSTTALCAARCERLFYATCAVCTACT